MKVSLPAHTFTVVASILLSSASFESAAMTAPTPLKEVEGLLIHSSTSVSSFKLNEGHYVGCEPSTPSLGAVRCALEGGQITLTRDNGEQVTVALTNMTYLKTTNSDQTYNHYIYRGVWKAEHSGYSVESNMSVNVIHVGTGTPDQVRGFLDISDLNVSEQLRGKANP